MTKTFDLENSVWLHLMTAAYDRWHKHEDWNYDRMVRECSAHERAAVLLGNLNYQVCNGGFCQWIDNGYALKGKEVVALLMDIANEVGCPIAAELAGKIDELLDHVDLGKKNQGFDDYWKHAKNSRGEDEDDYPTEGQEIAQGMDDWYYKKVQPKLLPAIEKWLSRV